MKRILQEPLLHFLLLGAAIFLGYGFVSKGTSDEPGTIVITQGQIEHLATGFAKTWQRPPTQEELSGLVEDHLKEEIYCREALALGLDKDDTVIRRRLRQKMEFVSDDIAAQKEPTDAELETYLKTHADMFRIEQRLTFRQVYLNPQKRGEHLAEDAANLLAQLNQAGSQVDASTQGDSFLLEHDFQALPARDIAKQFGEEFSAQLLTLKLGQWQGPIESGYGLHLLFVSDRTEGRLPALAEVRDAVRREWDNARRLEGNENFYQSLRQRYTVTIEQPAVEAKIPAEAQR